MKVRRQIAALVFVVLVFVCCRSEPLNPQSDYWRPNGAPWIQVSRPGCGPEERAAAWSRFAAGAIGHAFSEAKAADAMLKEYDERFCR